MTSVTRTLKQGVPAFGECRQLMWVKHVFQDLAQPFIIQFGQCSSPPVPDFELDIPELAREVLFGVKRILVIDQNQLPCTALA